MTFFKTYKIEIWLLLVPLSILLLLRILGFDGMVGQDSYTYVDYTKSIKHGILNSTHPGNFAWPQGYPLLGALFSFVGISVATSMQLISCLALSISLLFVFKILKVIYPKSASETILIYLLLFGVFSPYFLRNGMITMSDMLSCCFIIASIYFGYLYSKKYQLKHLIACVGVISFSLFVRYPSALILFPIVLFVIFSWMKSIRKITHFIVLAIPVGIYFLHTYFEKSSVDFLNHEAINFWSISNYFSSTFHTNQGAFNYPFPNLIYVFYPLAHYGFILLGIPFLFLLVKFKKINHPYIYLCIASYLSYILFVAGIDTQNSRHLLLLFPLVLVLCFYGFDKIYHLSTLYKFRKSLLSLGFVFQITLCILAFKVIFLRNQLEKNIAEQLINYENNTLYSFDIDIALKSRETNFKHINLWEKEYANFEQGGLVLFNEDKFKIQWKGENPMINWNNLTQNYHLVELEQFSNNWKLYQIE